MVYWVVVRTAPQGVGQDETRLGPFESVERAEAAAREHGRKTASRDSPSRQRVQIVCDYA